VSATASSLRSHLLEIAWGVFASANLGLMWIFPHYPTIPFHFIWISLTLVYGLRTWRSRPTTVTLVVVCLATGAMLWHLSINGEYIDAEEIAEVPLMASVFLAMVWHARRRQAALEDVHRLADSERVLRDRERLFSRQASHQLRSPITVARGHAQLVLQETAEPAVLDDVAIVIRELDTLNAIATRLLELGSLETPETLDLTTCDLAELVTGTVERWSRVADRRWSVSAAPQTAVVVDRERLQAALDELVDNAVKHTGTGGAVDLAVRPGHRHALVEVRDDGVGVAPGDLPRMFDQFWRGSRRRYHGSGLGLAIVKAVAEVHGGSVSATGSPGLGTTVTLALPLPPGRERLGQNARAAASGRGSVHYRP
jgi:two-component system, OmpR family, sensor kinase